MRKLIIIPVGSYEQHGPHLPLDTDYLIAEKISESIANMYFGKINKGIQIGISTEHDGFEKTKSITQDQFINEIEKKINNLDKNAKLVIINAHGGNIQALKVIEHLYQQKIFVFSIFSLIKEDLKKLRTSDLGGICHAGEFETSIMLYLYPELVKINKLSEEDIVYIPFLDPNYVKKKPKNWKTIHYSKSGILGDPYQATIEKGKKWFEIIVTKIIDSIRERL